MDKLLISNTPHVRGGASTKRIMIDVLIGLAPTTVAGIVFFGWRAALVLCLSVLSAVGSEVVFRLIRKERFKDILKSFDFTSAVTGLLLGLCLGSQTPVYAPILGGIFAIVVAKMLFGGTGKNFVNPAIAGRVFLTISFSAVSSGWLATAIPAIIETNNAVPSLLDMFIGTGITGCIGETSKVALILGGLYLVIRKVIKWQYPVIYIAVTGLMHSLYHLDFSFFLPSILSGGLMLGAIFMATDYVTTPNTKLGNYIYFALLGILTGLFREISGGEVVSYCILLMNVTVPLIDRFIVPKPFGYEKPVKVKKEAGNG